MGQYYVIVILADVKRAKEVVRTWMDPSQYDEGSKLIEHSYIGNPCVQALEKLICPEGMFYMSRIVWAGDYAEEDIGYGKNLYNVIKDKPSLLSYVESFNTSKYRYIVNHSKKTYVDKMAVTETGLHPLPLLVSEGNGKGGGDYYGVNKDLCGTWARDIISVEESIPTGFKELACAFDI